MIVVVMLAAGCGDPAATDGTPETSGPASQEPSTTTSAISALPLGKSDLELEAGGYASPAGFVPSMRFRVSSAWTSVHRGVDGFDLATTSSSGDAPLAIIAVLVPAESTAAAALQSVGERVNGSAEPTAGLLLGGMVDGLDITGGTGEIIASARAGIAIDAAPGQRVRVLTVDVEDQPLLVAVVVPDAARWDEAMTEVEPVLTSMARG